MSDHCHSMTIPVNTIATYWKGLDFGTLFILFILKTTNPIFKIALALHIGLQTILVLMYAPVVYYKSDGISGDEKDERLGLFQKISNFIPTMIKKISVLMLQLVLKVLRFIRIGHFKLNIDCLGSVVAYLLISFRKIIALLISIYVTSEDDESTHRKTIALFTIFILMQMKFVNGLKTKVAHKGLEPHCTDLRISIIRSLKLVFSLDLKKAPPNDVIFNLLDSLRNWLSKICTAVTYGLIYYSIQYPVEYIDSNFTWMLTLKILIVLDSIFATSFLIELSGLNFHFINKNDTIV